MDKLIGIAMLDVGTYHCRREQSSKIAPMHELIMSPQKATPEFCIYARLAKPAYGTVALFLTGCVAFLNPYSDVLLGGYHVFGFVITEIKERRDMSTYF